MELYFLRHGEAGQRSSALSKDFERTLTVAGKKEIERIAKVVDKMENKFDKIISSPLKRASETADILAKELKLADELEIWVELKPEGKREDLYKKLSRLKRDSTVLLVGHEPYLSTTISEIISGTPASRISLKKAGIARIRVMQFLPKPTGELRSLLTPRQLKSMD